MATENFIWRVEKIVEEWKKKELYFISELRWFTRIWHTFEVYALFAKNADVAVIGILSFGGSYFNYYRINRIYVVKGESDPESCYYEIFHTNQGSQYPVEIADDGKTFQAKRELTTGDGCVKVYYNLLEK